MTLDPETRLEELCRSGFSLPVRELSAGRYLHPLFEFRCRDPYYIYHGGTTPYKRTLIPIWEEGMVLTAVWRSGGRQEIIKFSLESPDDYWVIAYTEQGLWADFFAPLIENQDDANDSSIDEVREAAALVGFRFLDETINFVLANSEGDDFKDLLRAFTQNL